jgi:hypothetical protein
LKRILLATLNELTDVGIYILQRARMELTESLGLYNLEISETETNKLVWKENIFDEWKW